MASPIAQFRIWDKAKDLTRKFHHDEAITLYRSVETDIKNMQEWRQNKSERDMLFDQALFFGDYCGALADRGFYTEAKEMGNFALKCIEQGNFRTLKYIYYNIGNIYLFQSNYELALEWYEQALDKSEPQFLINFGIALYYLKRVEEAKTAFETLIEKSKGSKLADSFYHYFYLMKIYKMQGNEKMRYKFQKLYLTRLKKRPRIEIEWSISTMKTELEIEDGKEILADYENM